MSKRYFALLTKLGQDGDHTFLDILFKKQGCNYLPCLSRIERAETSIAVRALL